MPSYLSNINLNQNALISAVVQVLASAPGSPVAGQVYYDSTVKALFVYNGTTWIECDSQNLSFGSVTSQTAFNASSANGSATTAARADHTHGTPNTAAFASIPLSAHAAATANVSLGGFNLTSVADPTSAQMAATKNYVDSVSQGLSWKQAAQLATAATLPAYTYSNGTSGVGATLTATSNGALTVDGSTAMWAGVNFTVTGVTFSSTTITVTVASTTGMALGQPVSVSGITGFTTNNPNGDWTVSGTLTATTFQFVAALAPTGTYGSGGTVTGNAARVLVKNETSTNQPNNGIYTVTQIGTGSVPYILTRATDMDSGFALDTTVNKYAGAAVFVEQGTTNAATTWSCTNVGAVQPGTTNVNFAQVGTSTSYSAGTGLTLTGTTFSISASYVGQSSITTLGTIATGVWQSTAVAVLYGGTGATTAAGARTNLSSTSNPLPQSYSQTAVSTTGGSPTTITHNLGTNAVQVTVWSAATAGSVVYCDVANTSTNAITITTASSQSGLMVVCIG